jgi:hypothetical protein
MDSQSVKGRSFKLISWFEHARICSGAFNHFIWVFSPLLFVWAECFAPVLQWFCVHEGRHPDLLSKKTGQPELPVRLRIYDDNT